MLELDGESVADSFVAVERNGRLSVPVCALAEALSLAISCLDKKAYGFVLQESHPFLIDLEEGYVISGRKVFKVNDSAFMQDTDLLADIGELSKWLPVDMEFDKGSSTLRMHAREIFPRQGFKKRQQLIRVQPLTVPKQYLDFTPSRAALSVPTVDVTSQLLLSGENDAATRDIVRNSIDLSGDMSYMSNETHFLAENKRVKRLDATLFRRSEATFDVGPLPLTQVALGATQAPYVDGVGASTKPVYGLYLSNRPLFGSSNFLTHDINGYLPQGWDAELFHNGMQVAYQPPTPEAMYHFVNLRVYYGVNSFKIVQHGPFGERRETEEIFVSDAITPTGEYFYTLSAGWQTGLSRGDTTGIDRESNITLTSDFGVARGLTGSALFVRHTDFLGTEEDYAGVGIRTTIRYTLLSLDLIQSFAPEDGRNGQLLTAKSSSRDVFGLNLEVVQRFFNHFESPQFPQVADPLRTRTSVKGNSSFTLLDNIRVPFSVEIGVDTKESGNAEANSKWRVSGGWNGWNCVLESDLSYLQGKMRADGLVQLSTKLKGISIRGQAGVSVAPIVRPSVVDLSADKDLGGGYTINSGSLHDPVANVSSVRMGLSKRLGLFGYSISATGSSNGVYGVDLGLRASAAADRTNGQAVISAEPLSPYGMIAVSASVQQAGSAASPVAALGFLVNGNRATTITGSKG